MAHESGCPANDAKKNIFSRIANNVFVNKYKAAFAVLIASPFMWVILIIKAYLHI